MIPKTSNATGTTYVSIGIFAWNEEEAIARTLRSLFQQTLFVARAGSTTAIQRVLATWLLEATRGRNPVGVHWPGGPQHRLGEGLLIRAGRPIKEVTLLWWFCRAAAGFWFALGRWRGIRERVSPPSLGRPSEPNRPARGVGSPEAPA